MKSTFNKFITTIDKDKCMDCGSSDVHYIQELKRKAKECKRCGKAYYV